jgi:hypothetical protein
MLTSTWVKEVNATHVARFRHSCLLFCNFLLLNWTFSRNNQEEHTGETSDEKGNFAIQYLMRRLTQGAS